MLNFKSMSEEEENQTRCDVDGNNIAVVCIVTTLSLLYLIPYVICIISMLKDKKVLERPFYLLALSLGAADILQLLTNGPGIAVLTLTCKNGTLIRQHDLLNSSIGSVLNSAWEAGLAMILCMAINRFVSIYCEHHMVKMIFSRKNTKIYIAVCWFYGLCWFTVYQIPDGATVRYWFEYFAWDYDDSKAISRLFRSLEFYVDMFFITLMIVCYACIMVKLKMRRNNVVNTESMIVSKREWSVLLQAFLICVNVLFTILGFFLVPVFVSNKWVSFFTNLIWITCTGLNALIYIFLNQLIRRKFVELVKGKINSTMMVVQTGRFVPSPLANSAT